MSYKALRKAGQEQWNNWTRGLKQQPDPKRRQQCRKQVKALKRAASRAARLESKRLARFDGEAYRGEVRAESTLPTPCGPCPTCGSRRHDWCNEGIPLPARHTVTRTEALADLQAWFRRFP